MARWQKRPCHQRPALRRDRVCSSWSRVPPLLQERLSRIFTEKCEQQDGKGIWLFRDHFCAGSRRSQGLLSWRRIACGGVLELQHERIYCVRSSGLAHFAHPSGSVSAGVAGLRISSSRKALPPLPHSISAFESNFNFPLDIAPLFRGPEPGQQFVEFGLALGSKLKPREEIKRLANIAGVVEPACNGGQIVEPDRGVMRGLFKAQRPQRRGAKPRGTDSRCRAGASPSCARS